MSRDDRQTDSVSPPELVPEEGVFWVVEQEGISVLPAGGRQTCFLAYPQAAAWDLLMQGYSLERTTQMMGILCTWDGRHAAEQLHGWVLEWKGSGLIKDGIRHG